MFFGLLFPTFQRVDDEQRNIYTTYSRDHCANKICVSWNINKTQGLAPRGDDMSKSKIDCHAAPLLFGKTIGIRASDGLNE
ncbi:hypothetical protein LBMAG13_03870 [Actinomycetes bacterium]|nr:hypothetical protein LBMAG13_03870 [Actinomycetes bacterium]